MKYHASMYIKLALPFCNFSVGNIRFKMMKTQLKFQKRVGFIVHLKPFHMNLCDSLGMLNQSFIDFFLKFSKKIFKISVDFVKKVFENLKLVKMCSNTKKNPF